MDAWDLALYTVAAFLAVRILLGLMARHQVEYAARLDAEEAAAAEAAAPPEPVAPVPSPNERKTARRPQPTT